MLTPFELKPRQIEALRHLAHLGSVDTGRSLGRLLGTSVETAPPRAQVAPEGSAAARVLQKESSAFSVRFEVEGGARLRWMMHVTHEGAQLMSGLMLGSPLLAGRDPATLHDSALAEMSNIAVSSYVGGMAAASGLMLMPSVPHVGTDGVETTLREAFGDLGATLLLVTDLRLPGVRNAGRIVAAPVDESLERLVSIMGVA